MSELLSREDYERLLPAETAAFPAPIPTREYPTVSSCPIGRKKQREFEARIKDMGERLAKKLDLNRRQFLKTLSGMAAAFVAKNEVYGNIFEVDRHMLVAEQFSILH
jgi:hypothetical protein